MTYNQCAACFIYYFIIVVLLLITWLVERMMNRLCGNGSPQDELPFVHNAVAMPRVQGSRRRGLLYNASVCKQICPPRGCFGLLLSFVRVFSLGSGAFRRGFAFWLLYYYQVQGCDYVTRSRWGRAFAGGRWLVGGWRIQWDWFNWFLIGAVFVEGLEIGICSESITIPGFSLSDWMSNREITENISSIHHQPPPRI